MNMQTKDDHSNASIIDAVETLSHIADMELDKDVGITEDHELYIHENKFKYKTVHWLSQEDADKSIQLIREKFRIVLNYLENFYRKEYNQVTDPRAVDGIKTIMVLVGEAAKKLDKYTAMFHHVHTQSAMELKEYKQLQEFYLSRIARTIDEGILGQWILALSQRSLKRRKPTTAVSTLKGHKQPQTKHVFVDLESVKKDTEYELFFLRKEDGTRFFSPRLIRNIKLVCDFGNYFGESKGDDPLNDLPLIQDKYVQQSAKSLFKTLGAVIDRFYREGIIYRQNELVQGLNKTIIALMLSGNSNNLLRNQPIKTCSEYFIDFQKFLREITQSRDYQKLIAYPPKKTSKFSHCLLDTVHALCCAFFVSMQGFQDLAVVIQHFILEANQDQSSEHSNAVRNNPAIWNHLACDYAAMSKFVKRHPNGPLIKVLGSLERGQYHFFDPSIQHDLPGQYYSFFLNDQKMGCLHFPSPTYQEFINKATINEEFKAMLRAFSTEYMMLNKFLIINLQDRTSWKEHFRCTALEELQNAHQFEKQIIVVTLNHDTEFYNQLCPYHEENNVDHFMTHFKEHLSDESSGFFYPKQIKRALFPEFIDGVMKAVHQIFFDNKNVLTREKRMDFIQIFYLFLQLKIIEIVKPDCFSLTCKDGVDSGGAANTLFFSFIKTLTNSPLEDADYDCLNTMIYGPSLLVRERVIIPERFNRMLSALKTIEEIKDVYGDKFPKVIRNAFKKYYQSDVFDSRVSKSKATPTYSG